MVYLQWICTGIQLCNAVGGLQELSKLLQRALNEASKSSRLKRQLKDAQSVIQRQSELLTAMQEEVTTAHRQVCANRHIRPLLLRFPVWSTRKNKGVNLRRPPPMQHPINNT